MDTTRSSRCVAMGWFGSLSSAQCCHRIVHLLFIHFITNHHFYFFSSTDHTPSQWQCSQRSKPIAVSSHWQSSSPSAGRHTSHPVESTKSSSSQRGILHPYSGDHTEAYGKRNQAVYSINKFSDGAFSQSRVAVHDDSREAFDPHKLLKLNTVRCFSEFE